MVTIVIVTYGQWDLCRQALEAVVEHTEPVYEVVIVDNASPDGTTARLRDGVRGATLVCNDENYGFGAAANQGAQHALGPLLCFLNSDAFVTDGWLPPLLEVLERDEDAAAVAPRILNADGTLQDAGHLLDRTGITYALGYGDDSNRLDYRFTRALDYGSGACLLVRRRDFAAVGGFHPVYGRGYYEDVDLGLALTGADRRVVYEPRSVVRHLQRGSNLCDDSLADLVAGNRSTFRTRWSEEIVSRPSLEALEGNPHRLVAARDAGCHDRVLVIADREGRAEALARQLAHLWPTARVTLLHGHGVGAISDVPSLLEAGVELVQGDGDWRAWLELRRFHYSAVLFGSAAEHLAADAALARTQPQAMRLLHLGPLSPARSERRAQELAALGGAHVVLCASDDDRLVLAEAAPDVPVLTLGLHPSDSGGFHGAEFEMTMLSAMSHLGTAPPLSGFERRMARR